MYTTEFIHKINSVYINSIKVQKIGSDNMKILKRACMALISLFILLQCTGKPEKMETKVFTYYNGDAGAPKIDLFDTAVGTLIKSRTGFAFDISHIEGTNEIEAAKRMIQSGKLPDVIYGHKATTTFIEYDAVIPLNDLIETYGPNIKKYYGEHLNLFKNESGIIYYIGANHKKFNHLYPQMGFWISAEILETDGWPVVKTLDHYVALLRTFRNNTGQKGGLTFYTGNWESGSFITPAALLMGYPDHGDVYITDNRTLKTELIVRSSFGKKYVRLLNTLWHEKILDHEIFTQTFKRYTEKFLEGEAQGTFDYHININAPVLIEVEDRNLPDRQLIPFALLFDEGGKDYYNTIPSIPDYEGVGISVQCKEPEEIVKFWNRFLDEDIQKLVYWGMNRVHHYKINNEMRLSPEQFRMINVPENGTLRFIDGYPQRDQLTFYSDGNPVTPKALPEYYRSVMKKYLRNIFDIYEIPSFTAFSSPPEDIHMGTGQFQFIPEDHPAFGVKARIDEITRKYIELCITEPANQFDFYWNWMQKELSTLAVKAYLDYRTDLFVKREKKLGTQYTPY